MSYLESFQEQIKSGNKRKFQELWEEYCSSDEVDAAELVALLELIRASEMAEYGGGLVDSLLPLYEMLAPDSEESYDVLRAILDAQTTQSAKLAELATDALNKRYGNHPHMSRFLRIVGLRSDGTFSGAIRNFELLLHLKERNFVYHTSGWGTGEIMEVSMIREEITCEFENVMECKTLSFQNAFNTLIPLTPQHFRVQRFAFPDKLEEEMKADPVVGLRHLLRDLGPKTALEIKDELCGWVISEKMWTKWWQGARTRLKREEDIEVPKTLRQPFQLVDDALSHEEQFKQSLDDAGDIASTLLSAYNFVRDFPELFKKSDVEAFLEERLLSLLERPEITQSQVLQIRVFLETNFKNHKDSSKVADAIHACSDLRKSIDEIDILTIKKRALIAVKELLSDWQDIFLSIFYANTQNMIRDFIVGELVQPETRERLKNELRELLHHPTKHPDAFVWYFQKIMGKDELPYNSKEGRCDFLEAFLILLNIIEGQIQYKDLTKKMVQMITAKRYLMIREVIKDTSLSFVKEFLLLVSKCTSLSDHDKKILHSLAEVVHASLSKKRAKIEVEEIIWTSAAGFEKAKARLETLSKEIVENAREIEAARALGDLRENSEYKFALEKRNGLQAELKTLTEQVNIARMITPDDIDTSSVSVGTRVVVADKEGKRTTYTVLGPWDADADQGVLSVESKLVKSMLGKKAGDSFEIKDELLTIEEIRSIF